MKFPPRLPASIRFRLWLTALDDRITPAFDLAFASSSTVGVYQQAIAVSDLNGDGRPDIVLGGRVQRHRGGSVSAFANGWQPLLNSAAEAVEGAARPRFRPMSSQ